jgi:hypothetical protein
MVVQVSNRFVSGLFGHVRGEICQIQTGGVAGAPKKMWAKKGETQTWGVAVVAKKIGLALFSLRCVDFYYFVSLPPEA